MDDKPVIILGSGVWGSLLALRLRANSQTNFLLMGDPSAEEMSLCFHRRDLDPADYEFLKPFISHEWNEFQVNFPKYEKTLSEPYCVIDREQFYKKVSKELGKKFIQRDLSTEEALEMGSFVIDTRNLGYFKAQAYHKSLGLKLNLSHDHGLKLPNTFDVKVDQKNGFRFLQFFPLTETSLYVKDVRYSTDPNLYHEDFTSDLLEVLSERNLHLKEVLKSESDFRKVPLKKNYPANEGRVLRIDGLLHETSGEILMDALTLTRLLSETSFRLGEVKEVIKNYQLEKVEKAKIYKLVNKLLYKAPTRCHEKYQFFQFLYQLPAELRYKFYSGDVQLRDLSRACTQRPLSLLRAQTVKLLDISSQFRLFRSLNS